MSKNFTVIFGGLALLVQSLISPANAIEVNKSGFQLPAKFRTVERGPSDYDRVNLKLKSARSGNGGTLFDYVHQDGSGVSQYAVGPNNWMFVLWAEFPGYTKPLDLDTSKVGFHGVTALADNDCDGVFETMYQNKSEVMGILNSPNVPQCHYRK